VPTTTEPVAEIDPRFSPAVHGPDGDDPPAVAHVFAVRPAKVLAFGKGEPSSQTRFRFGDRS
jgi:hypothetical protein